VIAAAHAGTWYGPSAPGPAARARCCSSTQRWSLQKPAPSRPHTAPSPAKSSSSRLQRATNPRLSSTILRARASQSRGDQERHDAPLVIEDDHLAILPEVGEHSAAVVLAPGGGTRTAQEPEAERPRHRADEGLDVGGDRVVRRRHLDREEHAADGRAEVGGGARGKARRDDLAPVLLLHAPALTKRRRQHARTPQKDSRCFAAHRWAKGAAEEKMLAMAAEMWTQGPSFPMERPATLPSVSPAILTARQRGER